VNSKGKLNKQADQKEASSHSLAKAKAPVKARSENYEWHGGASSQKTDREREDG